VIEFVTSPTEDWLKTELSHCSAQFLISSPYVGTWLSTLNQSVRPTIRKVLLTRTDLRDFASGASDLDALCVLASRGTEIISSHRLHAKVYVIDDLCTLVTSANATFSGMRGNLECGVVIRGAQDVRQAAQLILSAFGASESPQQWTLAELETLKEPVQGLKEILSTRLIAPGIEDRALPNVSLNTPVGQLLRTHLPGWTRLALEGVQMQQQDIFDLDSLDATCSPVAAERYPNNRHVRAKLRQQLQRLRDLGLIEFLGGGLYRRNGSAA
jgi:hypothetical protein